MLLGKAAHASQLRLVSLRASAILFSESVFTAQLFFANFSTLSAADPLLKMSTSIWQHGSLV
jgi:hypothetical protein